MRSYWQSAMRYVNIWKSILRECLNRIGISSAFHQPEGFQEVSKETGAIPFDVMGKVVLDHHDGCCSFESILLKYDLKEPVLVRLGQIVHAADVSADIDKDPIARGLEAIATGYSLRFPEDLENLEHQFEVYDGLYAWCRLQVVKKKVVHSVWSFFPKRCIMLSNRLVLLSNFGGVND